MDQFVLEVVSLSPEEAFLFSDIGQKVKVLIEVIPYLLKSSLDFFSPLRTMNLGYTFLWGWISEYKLSWCVHLLIVHSAPRSKKDSTLSGYRLVSSSLHLSLSFLMSLKSMKSQAPSHVGSANSSECGLLDSCSIWLLLGLTLLFI